MPRLLQFIHGRGVLCQRGEIYYADLSPVVGSEQGGLRPVLIVQNDVGNRHSPTVIAAAITSQKDKAHLPTHIAVQADRCGLKAKRQFTLRLDEALLNKLGFIAEYEGRTKNKEIQHLIQQHIVHFEQEHGAIDLREIQQEEPVS